MIDRIEDAIVDRLKERLPGKVTRIEGFPDRPDEFDFPAGEQAAVFVRYSASDYGPGGDTPRAAYAPREALKFQIVYLVRSLRRSNNGPISAYDLKEEIRRALHGRAFCGTTPLTPLRNWLDGEHAGVWRWVIEFGASIPAVAEYPDHTP